MKYVAVLLMIAGVSRGEEPPALRCELPAKRDPLADYAAAYAACQRDQRPLIVFVGMPARPLPRCRCVAIDPCNAFPFRSPAVVVGRWQGQVLTRVDLAATASDDEIVLAGCEH